MKAFDLSQRGWGPVTNGMRVHSSHRTLSVSFRLESAMASCPSPRHKTLLFPATTAAFSALDPVFSTVQSQCLDCLSLPSHPQCNHCSFQSSSPRESAQPHNLASKTLDYDALPPLGLMSQHPGAPWRMHSSAATNLHKKQPLCAFPACAFVQPMPEARVSSPHCLCVQGTIRSCQHYLQNTS